MTRTPKTLKDVETTLIRKAKKQKHPAPEIAWNMRALGGYGWYVGLPLVGAVLVGRVLDTHFPRTPAFWTLIALAIGFVIGLINAHVWLIREVKKIHKKEDS